MYYSFRVNRRGQSLLRQKGTSSICVMAALWHIFPDLNKVQFTQGNSRKHFSLIPIIPFLLRHSYICHVYELAVGCIKWKAFYSSFHVETNTACNWPGHTSDFWFRYYDAQLMGLFDVWWLLVSHCKNLIVNWLVVHGRLVNECHVWLGSFHIC